MLAVDGQDGDLVLRGLARHFLAGHDEDFLAGHGDVLARTNGRQRRRESCRADDGDEDHVRLRHGRELDQPLGPAVACGAGGKFAAQRFSEFRRLVERDGARLEFTRLRE